jgi:hypothetical protein
MSNTPTSKGHSYERAMRAAGLVLGLGIVTLALLAWRLPTVRPDLGAEAAFSVTPTGELEVEPAGVFLDAQGLRPGSAPQTGGIAIRNQTGKTLAVSLHALPAARDLDDLVSVRLTSGGTTIFSGTLGGLRDWTKPLRLRSGERAPLRLRVSLPSTVRSGYAARIVSVPLELRSAA